MDNHLYRAFYLVLRPLVRILYRRNVSYGELSQLLKRVFVDVVADELKHSEEKVTTSRIATITGLTRKDVAQLRKADRVSQEPSLRYNRIVRMITGWTTDPLFSTALGAPRPLPLAGDKRSFEALVNRYSGDMTVRSVLDELVRIGVAEQQDDMVFLAQDAYVSGQDEEEGLAILGDDVSQLIATIDYNLTHADNEPRYQRKVSYNNLPTDAVPAFRKLAARENQKLLLKLNAWLAEHDRDSNPDVAGEGRMRAGVGIYYFEEPVLEPGTKTDED